MNLFEERLQKVLEENHDDFVESLQLSGIDVVHGIWTSETIEANAQAGALSLIHFASQDGIPNQCRNTFLQTVAENLDEEGRTLVMAWIYIIYAQTGRFPPYAIIQHMIAPTLFVEYCAFIQKYLLMYLQGYFPYPTNIV